MALSKDESLLLARYPVLRFFEYQHLSDRLKEVSKSFSELAWETALNRPYDTETSVALRKLLEAKDAAVRAETTR